MGSGRWPFLTTCSASTHSFVMGPAGNKGMVVRLADMYLTKTKERYPDNPWTKQSETLVQGIKAEVTP